MEYKWFFIAIIAGILSASVNDIYKDSKEKDFKIEAIKVGLEECPVDPTYRYSKTLLVKSCKEYTTEFYKNNS